MKIATLYILLLLGGTSQAQDLVPKVQPKDPLPGPKYYIVPPGQGPWLNRQDSSYITYSDWDNMPILKPKRVGPMPNAMEPPAPAPPHDQMAPMPNPMRPRRPGSPAQK
ncbi:hypothetical protein [Telluribacter sp.]|jgi:hypothetical protein|uniref:hypothetical protein n=1 Tax=Telluribacter sp. TaxID=1978767 RepID=UPI002E114E1D|nr:hypothetical protein [Telluribacter sp.]